jgi:hypothetical protein
MSATGAIWVGDSFTDKTAQWCQLAQPSAPVSAAPAAVAPTAVEATAEATAVAVAPEQKTLASVGIETNPGGVVDPDGAGSTTNAARDAAVAGPVSRSRSDRCGGDRHRGSTRRQQRCDVVHFDSHGGTPSMTSQYLYFKDCAPSQAISSALTPVNAPGQLESVPYLSAAVTSQPRETDLDQKELSAPRRPTGPVRMSVDMSPETESLRHALADRMDVLPPEDWSPGFIKAMTALFDLYIGDQLHERPATVLQLVKPVEGTKPLPWWRPRYLTSSVTPRQTDQLPDHRRLAPRQRQLSQSHRLVICLRTLGAAGLVC